MDFLLSVQLHFTINHPDLFGYVLKKVGEDHILISGLYESVFYFCARSYEKASR